MQEEAKDVIEWVEISKLKPHPNNRNQHPPDQITRLALLIKNHGWRHPIIVSTRSGFIAAGHGRLEAARELGLQKVPIHYQSFESEELEYQFLISDNAIASWAELDLSQIHVDLEHLDAFDIDLLGIRDFQFEPSEMDIKVGEPGEGAEPEVTQCPNCGHLLK